MKKFSKILLKVLANGISIIFLSAISIYMAFSIIYDIPFRILAGNFIWQLIYYFALAITGYDIISIFQKPEIPYGS